MPPETNPFPNDLQELGAIRPGNFSLEGLNTIARANIADFLDWKGNVVTLKDAAKIPKELLGAVKSVRQSDSAYGTQLTFVFHDKLKALELLGKDQGLFQGKPGGQPEPSTYIQVIGGQVLRLSDGEAPQVIEVEGNGLESQ